MHVAKAISSIFYTTYKVVDKMVVEVLLAGQPGLASIMGGGVGAGNMQETWDVQEMQDIQEMWDVQETQDAREMQDKQVDEE